MPIKLGGALASRGEEPIGAYCPIERAMAALRTRSAMLVLREAFYGATRFDQFAARAGLTDATTAAQLRELTAVGILEKHPYREPGSRRRHAYVLTEAGADLLPAVFALLQWGNRHDPPPYPPELSHDGCGEPVEIAVRCAAGHAVGVDDLRVTAAGPFGLGDPRDPDPSRRTRG